MMMVGRSPFLPRLAEGTDCSVQPAWVYGTILLLPIVLSRFSSEGKKDYYTYYILENRDLKILRFRRTDTGRVGRHVFLYFSIFPHVSFFSYLVITSHHAIQ